MPIKIAEHLKSLHAELDGLNLSPELRKEFYRYGADTNLVDFVVALIRHWQKFIQESSKDVCMSLLKKAISKMKYREINEDTVKGRTLIMNVMMARPNVEIMLTVLEAMSLKGVNLRNEQNVYTEYRLLESVVAGLVTAKNDSDKVLLPMVKPIAECTYDKDAVEEARESYIWYKKKCHERGHGNKFDAECDYMVSLLDKRMKYLETIAGKVMSAAVSNTFYGRQKVGTVQADDLRGMKQKENVKPVSANTLATNQACATTVRSHNQEPTHQGQGKRPTIVG